MNTVGIHKHRWLVASDGWGKCGCGAMQQFDAEPPSAAIDIVKQARRTGASWTVVSTMAGTNSSPGERAWSHPLTRLAKEGEGKAPAIPIPRDDQEEAWTALYKLEREYANTTDSVQRNVLRRRIDDLRRRA